MGYLSPTLLAKGESIQSSVFLFVVAQLPCGVESLISGFAVHLLPLYQPVWRLIDPFGKAGEIGLWPRRNQLAKRKGLF